jgi:hypothetical protein
LRRNVDIWILKFVIRNHYQKFHNVHIVHILDVNYVVTVPNNFVDDGGGDIIVVTNLPPGSTNVL